MLDEYAIHEPEEYVRGNQGIERARGKKNFSTNDSDSNFR
jgi:hypothetical protein